MRLTLFFSMFISVAFCSFSQKIKKVSAEYTFYAPETMSIEEAKRVALERAKIQAIADELGTTVSQSTSTIVSNNNGESETKFFSIGGSDVKGDWIETIGEPKYEILYENGMLLVSVSIRGKIRERTNMQIPLIIKTLCNGLSHKNESVEFRNGDEIYLLFQSPISGYLLVYLVDYGEDTVYGLLPYSTSTDDSQVIEGNREYLFFSEESVSRAERSKVDSYTLECDNSSENINDIVVIFSPTKLIKTNTIIINKAFPRQLSRKEFEEWKAKLLAQSTEIQIITKTILVKP